MTYVSPHNLIGERGGAIDVVRGCSWAHRLRPNGSAIGRVTEIGVIQRIDVDGQSTPMLREFLAASHGAEIKTA